MHAGERAGRLRGHEIAEAVAPAHDRVHGADVREIAKVPGDEERVDTGVGCGAAPSLQLTGRQVDPHRLVAGGGQPDTQAPVAAGNVQHPAAWRDAEQPAHHERVLLGHRRARRAPEASGQTALKAVKPIVGHPRGVIPARAGVLDNHW